MANIDQAFINAYQDAHPVSIPLSHFQRIDASPDEIPDEMLVLDDDSAAQPPVSHTLKGTAYPGAGLRADAPSEQPVANSPHFATRLPAQTVHPSTQAANPTQGSKTNGATGQAPAEEIVLPPLGKERKPLSTFAAPTAQPEAEFRAAYEVDSFRWPQMSLNLAFDAEQGIAPLVAQLSQLPETGRSLVGLAGSHARVGTTTVTLCLAKLLASAGQEVVLVDANFARGDLATQLDVEFDLGWDRLLRGELPLAECAIRSLEDGVTLVPLHGPTAIEAERLTSIHASVMAGILRYHHDLVLFDLGSADQDQQLATMEALCRHCRLDSTLIVADVRSDTVGSPNLAVLSQQLATGCLGIIGNRA